MATSDQLLAHATQLLAANRFAELVQFAVPLEQAWLARPAEAPNIAPLFLYALGTAYRGLGSRQAAVRAYLHGAQFAIEQKNTYELFVVLNSVAQTYFEQGEIASAGQFAQQSLVALAMHNLESGQKDAKTRRTEDVAQLVKLCQYRMTVKDLTGARPLLGLAREAAEAHRDFAALAQVFDLSAAAAQQAGEADRASLYLEEARAARKMAGGGAGKSKANVTGKKLKPPAVQTDASAWPALPPALENEMAAQEGKRTHIRAAREALERALIHQFQAIADGLIADRILKGQEVSLRAWAAQYLTRHPKNTADIWRTAPRPDAVTAPDTEDEEPAANSEASAMRKMVEFMRAKYPPDVAAYEKAFHLRIARRQVTRMKPEDLAEVRVRIYGGRVAVWREGRINAQLARLGSDLRLLVVGADLFRSHDLLAKADAAAKPPALSAFLLGETSPCASHFKAALFEFNHEWAVSPYLDAGSPGFTDQCRIGWRNRMFSGVTLNLEMGSPITMGYSQSLFGHEVGHLIQEYGFIHPGHFASWRAVVRDDICRFAQTPQRFGDIALAFYKTFEAFELQPQLAQGLLPPGEPKEKLELVEVVRELLQDGLLERTRDDKFVCRLYGDGREWLVE